MDNTVIRVPYVVLDGDFDEYGASLRIQKMLVDSFFADRMPVVTWELVGTTPQGAQYVASSYDVLAAALDDQARLERHERWQRELDVQVRGVGRGGCTFVVRQAGLP